eukprot:TRINITY_DN8773_c0_g1_i1.p1 TRINITY_DN8773_c0_g1~~TRINITY_DN8773_c0_g1_i1.p1  ORF type:complete len:326 (+),score=69.45 TRINITY_DN8773_c0_g1_i1:707-1684(+)
MSAFYNPMAYMQAPQHQQSMQPQYILDYAQHHPDLSSVKVGHDSLDDLSEESLSPPPDTKKRSRAMKKTVASKKQLITRADSFSAYATENNNNSESAVSPTSTPKRSQLRVIQTENGTRIETDTASYLLPNARNNALSGVQISKDKYVHDPSLLLGDPMNASNMNAANDQSLSSFGGAFVMGSCHQCKRKREISVHSLCKSRKGMKNCKLKYCDVCLKNHYPQIAPPALMGNPVVDMESAEWKCPKCRGICHCVSCKRSIEKKQIKASASSSSEENSSPVMSSHHHHPMVMVPAPQQLNHPNIQHLANMIQASGFQIISMGDPKQ